MGTCCASSSSVLAMAPRRTTSAGITVTLTGPWDVMLGLRSPNPISPSMGAAENPVRRRPIRHRGTFATAARATGGR